jgi:M6 family metalloprotease-like protein
MKLFSLLFLIFISFSHSITPPNKGNFPPEMTKFLKDNPDFIKYGNPGWVEKMNDLKKLNAGLSKSTALQAAFSLPVLLGSYSDSSGLILPADFQTLLFGVNPTGNLTEYYDEISYGNFSLSGQVYGWFTADESFEYYTGDDNGNNGAFPQNVKGFVYNIVSKSDGSVDFSQYDNDGADGIPNSGDDDGYVDGVCIVYAGAGAEWFPGNDNFWPHMSSLGENEYITNDVSENGGNIRVSTYFVCPEESGGGAGNGTIRPIGVFAHEFGHVLGLPDLYDRTDSDSGPDFEDSEGIGEWCLMASGSWGGDGAHSEKPSHMSAWCKYKLGWLEPTIITEPVVGITLNQAATNAEALLLWEDPYALNRFFLIENRQKTGFDQYLNGDGILIFHIDEIKNIPWNGFQNDIETHKLVDIEEGDGNADLDNNNNRGDAGDTFPGQSNNTFFNDLSIPSALDYNNQPTGISITNISASSPSMSMNVTPRQMAGYSVFYDEGGFTGYGVGSGTADDTWGAVVFQASAEGSLKAIDVAFREPNTNYTINVYNTINFDNPNYTLSGLRTSQNGTALNAGWQTINLIEEVVLVENQIFVVSLGIENKIYALAVDYYGQSDNNSYLSWDNGFYQSIGSFGDLNIRAKVLTDDLVSVVTNKVNTPEKFSLSQNYPNPFNNSTHINYTLPFDSHISLKIYNVNGQLVETLEEDYKKSGEYRIPFNGDDLASGIYLYKLNAGEYSAVHKMILIK